MHKVRKTTIRDAKANLGVRQLIYGGHRRETLALEQAKKDLKLSFQPVTDHNGYCIVNSIMNADMSLGVISFDVAYMRKKYLSHNDVEDVKCRNQ